MEAMPQEPNLYIIIGSFGFACVGLLALVSLRGWREWIDFKRAELESLQQSSHDSAPSAVSRIEVADLKERVKKLEAIAAGIDI
jgi:hypothetical protein